ncbi:MAG: hypothetical protein E7K72_11825 [Roseomonas mucosa]|nr:hypothetical protein [Roseomonas mucosa]
MSDVSDALRRAVQQVADAAYRAGKARAPLQVDDLQTYAAALVMPAVNAQIRQLRLAATRQQAEPPEDGP